MRTEDYTSTGGQGSVRNTSKGNGKKAKKKQATVYQFTTVLRRKKSTVSNAI